MIIMIEETDEQIEFDPRISGLVPIYENIHIHFQEICDPCFDFI